MGFTRNIKPFVDNELLQAESAATPELAFAHLERAHVLGQSSTLHHVRAHIRMLQWAWKQQNWREMFGQLFRIAGASTKTAAGLVPSGNTGGSNISPFKKLPLEPELARIIESAKYN